MEKRDARGFFEVEWKKFILPILLIILFGYLVYVYFSVANITDQTSCYILEQGNLIRKYYEQGNEKMLQKTMDETVLTLSQISSKFNVGIAYGSSFWLISSISRIYPFFPVSCEVAFSPGEQCRYYISKESYDCMLEPINSSGDGISGILSIFSVNVPEYRKVSTFMLVLHFILIFIWGYLISAILLFLFRSLKKKTPKA